MRHLDGVVALLVLAEQEDVGLVCRSPAVEEERVLRDDELAERCRWVGRFRGQRPTAGFHKYAGGLGVANVG